MRTLLQFSLLALILIFSLSSRAQTFNGQGGVLIPPGAPSETRGVSSSFATVTGVGTIGSCVRIEDVTLDIEHTFVGDIAIFLISPSGSVLEFVSGVGGGGDDFAGTVFTDDAGINIVDGAPPFSGAYNPEGRQTNTGGGPYPNTNPAGTFTFANTFAGEPADGDWELLVDDYVAIDVGEILSWSITFTDEGDFEVDAGEDQTICAGAEATLTVDGPATAQYDWSDGQSGQTITVSPASSTTYTVTVNDAGCEAEDEVEVLVNPLYNVTFSGVLVPSSCTESIITLSVDVSEIPVGTEFNYRITISNGDVLEATAIVEADGQLDLTYITSENVTITLESLTVDDCPTTIINPVLEFMIDPPIEVTIDGPDEFCIGAEITLIASGADTYTWSTGDSGPSITVTPTEPTTYTVTGTSGACSTTADFLAEPTDFIVDISADDEQVCPGGSTNITVSGASPAASIVWSTGDIDVSTISVSPTINTVYSVTVTEDGCTATTAIEIGVVEATSTSLSVDEEVICIGESAILIVDVGGYANDDIIDFEINDDQGGTITVTGINPGSGDNEVPVSPTVTTTYTLSFLTVNGCSAPIDAATVTVTVDELPILTIDGPLTTCPGQTITLTATGANTYQWDTGDTDAAIEVMPASTTTYEVEGFQGECSIIESITVEVVPLDATIESATQVICEGESLDLEVVTSLSNPVYDWSTGDGDIAIITITPDQTDTYSVTVTEDGCETTDEILIEVDEIPDLFIEGPLEGCEGEPITLVAQTDAGNPDFEWSTGQISSSIIDTPFGSTTYSVTVTQGACAATDEVFVTINPLPELDLGPDQSFCLGEDIELFNGVNGTGDYEWSTGETTNFITVSPVFFETYSVTLTENGCSSEDEISLDPIAFDVFVSEDITICIGQEVSLTASGADDYEWNTGDLDATIFVTPTETTTYVVTGIVDECEQEAEVTVFVNEVVPVDAGPDVEICQGEFITLTATGDGPFLWSTGDEGESIEVSPRNSTIYTVEAGSDECQSIDEIEVIVRPPAFVDLGPDFDLCIGNSATLTVNDIDDAIYDWSTGEQTQSIEVSPGATTLYTVTVTDENGCESIGDVQATVTEVNVSIAEVPAICAGESVSLTASGSDNYRWNTGEITASINVQPSTTTVYDVSTMNNGCSATASVTVNVVATPEVTAPVDATICSGDSIVLAATGTGPFQWSTGEVADAITVQPTTATNYTVTAGGGGCSASDEVNVSVQALPTLTVNNVQQVCAGESLDLTAATNGMGSISWSTGESGNSINVSPIAISTYSVSVTENGCSNSDSIVVIPFTPNVSIAEVPAICAGEAVTLTASGSDNYTWSTGENGPSITVQPNTTTDYSVSTLQNSCSAEASVTVAVIAAPEVTTSADATICIGDSIILTATGSGPFQWSTGEVATSIVVQPTTDASYTVSVGSDGCSAMDDVNISVQSLPVLTVENAQQVCAGESIELTVSTSGSGTFSWDTGENGASITVSPMETTTYEVSVSDNGCIKSDSIVVSIFTPTVSVAEVPAICVGESVTLIASGSDNYSWSTGESGASISVQPTTTTNYTVSTVQNNCPATASVTVTVIASPEVTAPADASICAGERIELIAMGTGPFQWSTGEVAESITVQPSQATNYTVTAGSGACNATDEVTITVQALPTLSVDNTQQVCAGESIELTATTTGVGTINWNTGESGSSISVSPGEITTYEVSVTENGCTVSENIEVIPISPSVSIAEVAAICTGESVTLTASGSDNYSWSTGESGASISVQPTTTTNYTVSTVQNNCPATASVTVTVIASPEVTAPADVNICAGESVELIATGTGPFQWSTGEVAESIVVQPTAEITYTVSVGSGACSAEDDVTVSVQALPTLVVDDVQAVCLGEDVVLAAVTNGMGSIRWSTGEVGASISVNPTITTVYGVSVSENGCGNEASVEVDVLPVPSIDILTEDCTTDGTSYMVTASIAGGTAPYLSSMGTIEDILLQAELPSGIPQVLTITDANGCSDSIISEVDCGCPEVTIPNLPSYCIDGGGSIALSVLLSDDVASGNWQLLNESGMLVAGAIRDNRISISDLTIGNFTLVYQLDEVSVDCENSFDTNLEVLAPFSAGITLEEPTTLCAGETVSVELFSQLVNPSNDGIWEQLRSTEVPQLSLIPETGEVNISDAPVGSYQFRYTVPAVADCAAESVVVDLVVQSPEANIEVVPESCLSACSGLLAVEGGEADWQYSLDGAAEQNSPIFANLCAGVYTLAMEDEQGCRQTQAITIAAAPELAVRIDGVSTLSLGDSIQLTAIGIGNQLTYSWDAETPVRCETPNCETIWLSPQTSQNITVTATNTDGCTTVATVNLLVDRRMQLYIPNAFSPNDDGDNDFFTFYPGQGVVAVRNFFIFDRWGAQQFIGEWVLGQETPVWDGRENGQDANLGVYVYLMEVELLDGRKETVAGEVVLVR